LLGDDNSTAFIHHSTDCASASYIYIPPIDRRHCSGCLGLSRSYEARFGHGKPVQNDSRPWKAWGSLPSTTTHQNTLSGLINDSTVVYVFHDMAALFLPLIHADRAGIGRSSRISTQKATRCCLKRYIQLILNLNINIASLV
jgi:hypothetical protein